MNLTAVPAPQPTRCMLSITDVCETLQVSKPTVRRWITEGLLLHYRLGKQIRIKPADLEAFVAARQATSAPNCLDFLK